MKARPYSSEAKYCLTLLLFLAAFWMTGIKHASAQGITTGSIRGKVISPEGEGISFLLVSLRNKATQVEKESITDDEGRFAFANLPVGTYSLRILAQGFLPIEKTALTVQAGEATALGDLQLQLETSEVVEVEEQSTPMPKNEAQTSVTFTASMLEDLPLLNQFSKLADLIPGTVATQTQNFSVPAYIARLQSGNFSVNGRSLRSNNFQIDGQSNNDTTVGGQQLEITNEDALEEVEVVTNNFRAQYGRGTGVLVNLITRSGGNQFHGSGYEFYTGSWLSSLQNTQKNPVLGYCTGTQTPSIDKCVRAVVPRSVTNEWGATLSGPVWKNKAWAFAGTDWLRTRNGKTIANSQPYVTPTPTGLKTLSQYVNQKPALMSLTQYGPYSVQQGDPQPLGKPISAVLTIDGVKQTVEFAPVMRSLQTMVDNEQHIGRMDWQINDANHAFLRYLYQGEVQSPGGGTISTGSFVDTKRVGHSITSDWTHSFNPHLVNQLRYSFQQTKINMEGGATENCLVTDPSDCPSQVIINGSIQGAKLAGYGYPNYYPQGRTMKNNQVQNNVTWMHGKHTLASGFEYDYQNSPNTTLPFYNGSYNFSSFSNFLSGTGTLRLSDGSFVKRFVEQDAAIYFSDDYRVHPNLTLSLGLRWEFFENPVNILHDQTLKRESGSSHLWATTIPLAQRTFPEIKNYYKNFEPRIGFAWMPSLLEGKMVVRGGYSIGVDPTLYAIYLDAATSAPVVNVGSIACSGVCLPSEGTNGAAVRDLNLPSLPNKVNPNTRDQTLVDTNLRQPYAQFYALGVEYQMHPSITLSLGYVGDHSIGDLQSINGNPRLDSIAADFSNYTVPSLCESTSSNKNPAGLGRLNCNISLLRTRANTAFSIYNSVVAGLRFDSFHGLSGIAAYTFGRTIDNASEIFSVGIGGNTDTFAQNPLNTNVAERGLSSYSFPHIVSMGLDWSIPVFKDSPNKLGKLLGGWSMSSIYAYHSGQAFTPFEQVTSAVGDTSYCDGSFDNAFNVVSTASGAISDCRPVLSNQKAALNTIGILLDADQASRLTVQKTSGYYLYNATDKTFANYGKLNQQVDPSNVHWLWNNKNLAKALRNPFPGVSRNTLKGRAYNNLDAAIYKNFWVTDRVRMQIRAVASNLFNYQYIQVPDNNMEDSNPLGSVNPFLSTAYMTSNNRTIQLGLRLSF